MMVDTSSRDSLAYAKLLLLEIFMGRADSKFMPKRHYAIEAVYHHILLNYTDDFDNIMKSHYTVTRQCLTPLCPANKRTDDTTRNRELYIFESCSILDNEGPDKSIAELMSKYWARKIHRCTQCKDLQHISRQFQTKNPIIIAFSLNLMDTPIAPSITFEGSTYDVFAVGYGVGAHFIARIRIDDDVYEYDGIKKHGLLQLIHDKNPFTKKIRSETLAQMVWHKIKDN